MKKKVEKRPLMNQNHLPLLLLGTAMVLYGLVSALVWSLSSNQAMKGLITAGQLRTRLAQFESSAGLITGIAFLVLFTWCAVVSKGGPRAAFIVGVFASFAPILAGRSETLLFDVLHLQLPAGSVIAGALTTLVFTLPMTIFFIIIASSRRVPRACRWLAFGCILIILGTAFFPIYVTVLAFLIKPGDPAVGRMMETGSKIIKLRYILPGIGILFLGYLSMRFAHKHPPIANTNPVTNQGDTK